MLKKILIIAVCSIVAGHFAPIRGGNLSSKSSSLLRQNGSEGQARLSSSNSSAAKPSVDEWFQAIHDENVPKIKKLINKQANVDAETKSGWTALMTAAYAGNMDVVKVLIAAHANLNLQQRYGRGQTALMLAVSAYKINTVTVLIMATIAAEKATNDDQAANDNTQAHPFDIQDNDGKATALHLLVHQAHNMIMLIKNCALLPNRGTEEMYTDFINKEIASINSLINIMLHAGADPMIKNEAGKTPVDLAIDAGIYDQLPFANYFKEKEQMVVGDHLAQGDRYMIEDVARIVGEY